MVEVVPLIEAIGKTIAIFIINYIIYRYGVTSSIITDNGGQFKKKDLKELYAKFRITQHLSSSTTLSDTYTRICAVKFNLALV